MRNIIKNIFGYEVKAVENYRIALETTAKHEAKGFLRCEAIGLKNNGAVTGGQLSYSVKVRRQDPITRLGNLGRA